MTDRPPTARTFLFASAFSFALALAFWAMYTEGEENGFFKIMTARFCASCERLVWRASDPVMFEVWAAVLILVSVGFICLGLWSLRSAWKLLK